MQIFICAQERRQRNTNVDIENRNLESKDAKRKKETYGEGEIRRHKETRDRHPERAKLSRDRDGVTEIWREIGKKTEGAGIREQ